MDFAVWRVGSCFKSDVDLTGPNSELQVGKQNLYTIIYRIKNTFYNHLLYKVFLNLFSNELNKPISGQLPQFIY